MKTTTRYIDEYEYESVNEAGNSVKMDMYPAEQKQHQSPMEILLSAVGACAAVDMIGILKKKRKTVNDLVIESDGTRRNEFPKYFTNIDMKFILTSPDTSVEEFEKTVALTLEKYCSVSATLAGVAKIDFSCEVR